MKNTIEAFKAEDKNAMLQRQGEALWTCIQSGAFWQAGVALPDPGFQTIFFPHLISANESMILYFRNLFA
jgi:hypothetical protein